ncbi:MAG TPA: SAM-dependent methyltransferase, partial [Myxococcales bacterium]|nr:SAM-dependent methyltransferase [Myxococcales bacterium]
MSRRRKNAQQAKPARQRVSAGKVHRELIEGQSAALLQELHLLTRRGDLNADARRKLKQINHYCSQLRPHMESLLSDEDH